MVNFTNSTTFNLKFSEEEVKTRAIAFFKSVHPIEAWKEIGLFDEDFIETINVHWLRFEPPQKVNFYILAVSYIFIMIIGWFGNAFVISMFFRCSSLQTPANTLVMNLAISDLLMMSEMPLFIFNSFNFGPALGKIGCHIFGFVGGLSGTVSIITLAAISLDRYYVIKFPLHMRFTRLRAKICAIVAWIYGLIFAVIPLLNMKFGSYVPEGYLTSCSFDYLSKNKEVKIFIWVFFVAAWVLPFTVITFCYVNILKAVIKTKIVARKDTESSRHVKLQEKQQQEIKLAGTILLVITLWFAAWTPYAIVSLLGITDNEELISPLASMIPAVFCKSASCIDPFVYAITNAKFKEEVCKLYFKRFGRKNTARVWSVLQSETIGKPASKSEKLYRMHSYQDSGEIEEEVVLVELKKQETPREETKTFASPSSEVSEDVKTAMGVYKPSWWYKPNFSNRNSSLRSLARNLHQKQESFQCFNCEHCD